ncbi:alanine racemase [Mesorhizobium sp. VK23B]|uniref:Alanine racemase n=1 Tax=Mesorhizobium dulcispinae TaxID=3072316 RepID=A0ABU4XDA1_9HYPH|nr:MULTISPECIES: alanine racemase [unclassified Mesorhizobium]MDX8465679.1 alanine racemase [Mesorhizobium sp. VK23B]MDX8471519.1 alanine racemase [Mesorhizobium sp. VK23A]
MNASEQLDHTVRGIPPGVDIPDRAVATQRWAPADGSMALPVLTMDMEAFASNAKAFLEFAADEGVDLAPHAKTPMIPEIAASLVERGAWGATVANTQQLAVILGGGIRNIIFASPPGGAIGCAHLAKTLSLYPGSNVYVFLDSFETVNALCSALKQNPGTTAYGLIEVGFGRTGARTLERCLEIRDAIRETGGAIRLGGIATYEAAAITATESSAATFARLFRLVADAYASVVAETRSDEPVIISAGGSVYFDEVIHALKPLVVERRESKLVLRSGALFFSDDGLYQRAFSAMAERGLATPIARAVRPTLSLWAEVISVPEDRLAIAGFGMRDAPNDQGLPIVRRVLRDGKAVEIDPSLLPQVDKLNDQHAFLVGRSVGRLKVGDIIELGISHPCTALQRWRVVFGLGKDGRVERVFRTQFG